MKYVALAVTVLIGALVLYLGRQLLPGKTRGQKRAWLIAAALTLCITAFAFGYCGGGAAFTEIEARLQILWPNFAALPNADKGLLVGAAIKCHLLQEPPEVATVLSCVRRGAELLDEHNPTLDAPHQVERLLNSSRLGTSAR
jgi:hypothetical protein